MDFFDFEKQCMAFVEDVLKQKSDPRLYPIFHEGENRYRMSGKTKILWSIDAQWTIHHETDILLDDGTGHVVVTGKGATLMDAWICVGKETQKNRNQESS